ncbi:uncharacterized protein BX663DRAFT_555854 [Cokeromyces recurvatus]|uniref:uncharacterized protein n=1 Tax=Cokeromyces recurvatus TaxID=90255 RepID=UPI0022208786|nr:uncharacterized protein BX663DRAFT_555854 [Cokeromyces recurvatus]KAI7898491.1 hypothetical protein BX663DRAFT_555854 [Cokeromyces recurvatus]
MTWGYVCQNYVPDIPPYAWPIVIAECQGRETDCQEGYNYGTAKDLCLKGCERYYRCEQAGGQPSRSQSE